MIDELLPELPILRNNRIQLIECPIPDLLCSNCTIYLGLCDNDDCPGVGIWDKHAQNIKELL